MRRSNLFVLLFALLANPLFADDLPYPCAGNVFALVNRPSQTGSPCVVPNKHVMLEAGYQYLNLSGNAHGYITPVSELRVGLPRNTEFLFAAPDYFHQTEAPRAGWSSVLLSVKHELGYNDQWLATVEGILGVPSGSENYGNRHFSGTLNGILLYNVTPVFSLTGTLGVMSQSVQYIQNGTRFNSINPDVIASWQLTDKWQTYLELYGQTRTGPGESAGLLTDAGIFYLVNPRFSIDAGLGQRLTGAWGFQSYATVGLAWMIK